MFGIAVSSMPRPVTCYMIQFPCYLSPDFPQTRGQAMPRTKAQQPSAPPPSAPKDIGDVFPTPSLDDEHIRMSYEIARGEQGVLTFEPYKSILLPHWRFRTVPIAEESSKTLKGAFDYYVEKEDFVGSDMARKFIQMGMTRAKRYVYVGLI